MKAKLKVGVLFLTLVIPVFIFLFLKGFGENEFAVPVYFSSGIPLDTIDCTFADEPHKVKPVDYFDVLKEQNNAIFTQKLTVIDINKDTAVYTDPVEPSVQRILDLSRSYPPVSILSVRKSVADREKINERIANIEPGWQVLYVNQESLIEFGRCQLILKDLDQNMDNWKKRYVLVDENGRIRGYYLADDYEEIDRLILEMKIILQEEY